MDYPKYDVEMNSDMTIYQFTSIGVNGQISKAIKYTNTKYENICNLGFGDVLSIDENTGEVRIDDKIVSDNGDRDIVLATVAQSAYIFTETYPGKYLIFKGSTPARTRLYRIAITKNYEEISKTFHIFGAILNKFGQLTNVPFEFNINYEAFFIKRKENENNS